MSDLQRYVELYRQASELDTDVLWQKVNTIREAIADGADVETLLTECGKESGDSAKQVRKFYAVAMIWGNDEIAVAANYDYWLYEVAATAPGVIPDEPGTYFIARKWINEVEKREIKRGKKTIHAKHTARTLRAAIRAAAGPKPSTRETETVYKGEATVHNVITVGSDTHPALNIPIVALTLRNFTDFEIGETVTVTITRVPSPATATAESEVVV